MSYKLNKTDGSLLVDLVDGKVDSSTTNLTFIGKNYQGFGEFINENFIKLLENFSNTAAPSKPIKGQLWYDSSTGRLKIYDGTTFRSTDSTIYNSTRPTDLIDGDIWIDGSNDQMYFYNGIDLILVGPGYSKTQQLSGNVTETIKDTTGQNKIISKFYVNGSLIGIWTKEAFTPFPAITGFTSFVAGFNVSSVFAGYKWTGTASSATQIIDEYGNVFNSDSFLSSTSDDTTTGRIHIKNDNGLLVGDDSDLEIRVSGTTTRLQNTRTNANFDIQLKNSGGQYAAIKFVAETKKVGIFNDAPTADVHIGTVSDPKSLLITGDLTVQGDTTYLDITTLRVQDKQIELGITDDSTLLTEAQASGAGIVIPVTGDNKYLVWTESVSAVPLTTDLYGLDNEIPAEYTADNSWNINSNFNIPNLHWYKVENVNVLSKETLGSTVVNSSLTSVGTLYNLTVDNIIIDGNRITSDLAGLEIQSSGDIELITQQKIINVKTPVSARAVAANPLLTEDDDQVVATKGYVDDEISSVEKVFGIDITGMTSPDPAGTNDGPTDDVAIVLGELFPVTPPNGTTIRVYCTNHTAVTGTVDVSTGISKSFVAVDAGGTLNQSVIEDFSISNPSGSSVAITVTRYIMTFRVVAGLWDHVSTTTSAV